MDEIASSVGLGWTLNAGGCIAITVKGSEDLSLDGFVSSDVFLSTEQINNLPDDNTKMFKVFSMFGQVKQIDKESDIYTYNFGGDVKSMLLYQTYP